MTNQQPATTNQPASPAIEWMRHAIRAGLIEAIEWSNDRIREYAEAQQDQCDEYGIEDATTTPAMREWARGEEPTNPEPTTDIEDADNGPDIGDCDPDWNADPGMQWREYAITNGIDAEEVREWDNDETAEYANEQIAESAMAGTIHEDGITAAMQQWAMARD